MLLEPLIEGRADVVYGSRFLSACPHRVLYCWHSVGNRIRALLSNALINFNLSDMETCYKAFRREVILSIPLEEKRFGFEPEITAKIAKRRLSIYEVGITTGAVPMKRARKLKDGVRALWCLVKYCITETRGCATDNDDAGRHHSADGWPDIGPFAPCGVGDPRTRPPNSSS